MASARKEPKNPSSTGARSPAGADKRKTSDGKIGIAPSKTPSKVPGVAKELCDRPVEGSVDAGPKGGRNAETPVMTRHGAFDYSSKV